MLGDGIEVLAKPGRRFTFIDSMRGFAASWVAIFHINKIGGDHTRYAGNAHQSYYDFMMSGALGVTIFFVISGFAVHSSLLRTDSVRDFLARRFWRIYPPYIASLAVVMAVIIVHKLLTGNNDLIGVPHNALGWIATLTLTTQPATTVAPINWVYWTLTYELAFYLWLSLALLVPRARWAVLVTPAVLALFWTSEKTFVPLFFIYQWCFFALGTALAEWDRERGWRPIGLAVLCLATMIVHRTWLETSVALLAAFLIVASTAPWGDWLNGERVLRKLGDWSYSIYLIHLPIGCWIALGAIDPWPRKLSQAGLAVHLGIDLSAFAVTVAFAWGFWRLVEKPSIARSKAVGRKPAPTPEPLAYA